ncbi:MAG: DNA polymerase III subunit gamma/tau, partial [Pseudomonadota bacterium]
FNALLKSLEEPPPHVKFIFATTEIRKVPVTVLSRCQRFDLKRLDSAGLTKHLARVCDDEGASVSGAGLALIARAAEGSVRDALSILDQAIVQNEDDGEVGEAAVRDMLGLGDRTRLFDIFEKAISGDAKGAAEEVQDQVVKGADPMVLLKDLLDICAEVATAQAMGDAYDPGAPDEWIERTRALSQRLSTGQSTRYWQLLLSGYRDAQSAPEADTAARMVVIRLAAAASLPSPEDAARLLSGSEQGAAPSSAVDAHSGGSGPTSWTEIVDLMDAARAVDLSVLAAKYVRPIAVEPGRLRVSLAQGAPRDAMRRVAAFLETETGETWQVSVDEDASASETLKERSERLRAERIASVSDHPFVQEAMKAFPGAEIVDVRQEGPAVAGDGGDNIVPLDKKRA